jgi:DNA-binding GntR family transcriptional regulator
MLVHSLQLLSYRVEQHAKAVNDEHLAVVRALLRRDADLAERLLGEHIEASKRRALAFFLEKNGKQALEATTSRNETRANQVLVRK